MANVLVVEDDLSVARLLARSLAFSGHEVRTALDVETALSVIAEDWPDVVTLDLVVGPSNGGDVLLAARRLDSRARFLILSGSGAREAFESLGADAWASKPFDPALVALQVDELAMFARLTENALTDGPVREAQEPNRDRSCSSDARQGSMDTWSSCI